MRRLVPSEKHELPGPGLDLEHTVPDERPRADRFPLMRGNVPPRAEGSRLLAAIRWRGLQIHATSFKA